MGIIERNYSGIEKKIIKISEFYHKNYLQLKNKIQENFKSLGYEHFSLLDEFKEIFR